jgi:hypothetical protein
MPFLAGVKQCASPPHVLANISLQNTSQSGTIDYVSRGGAVWSARVAHNHEVVGSNPAPATKKNSYRKIAIFLGYDVLT